MLQTFVNDEIGLSVRDKFNSNVDKLNGRGEYSDTTSQKPVNTTPVAVTFDTDDIASTTITRVGGEFTMNEDYSYAFFLGFQVERTVTGGGAEDIIIWAQTDIGAGWVNVLHSSVKYSLDGDISTVIFLNIVHAAAVGDKIRFMQKVTNSTKGMGLLAEAAGADYPSIPSVILTVI